MFLVCYKEDRSS